MLPHHKILVVILAGWSATLIASLVYWRPMVWLWGVGLSLIVWLALKLWQKPWTVLVGLVFWGALGWLSFSYNHLFRFTDDVTISGSGTVIQTGTWGENSALYVQGQINQHPARALIISRQLQPVYARVRFSGWARMVTNQTEDADFQKVLTANGYSLILDNPDQLEVELPIWLKPFWALREKSTTNLAQNFSLEEEALLAPLVIGDRSLLTKEQNASLNHLGLSHIMSVSGMHLIFVLQLFGLLFFFLPKRWRFIGIVSAVLGYIALVGFMPPVVRAGWMIGIALLGEKLGRRAYSINALLLTGLVMVLLDPWALPNISFQLSFASTLGIMLFGPLLGSQKFDPLIQPVPVTIAATLTTLPLAAWHFKYISLVAIASNLLVLPVVSWLTIIGLIYAILGATYVSSLLALVLKPMLFYLSLIIDRFGGWSGAVMTLPQFGVGYVVGYYLILAVAYWVWFKLKPKTIYEMG